jgi:hypothetical protein
MPKECQDDIGDRTGELRMMMLGDARIPGQSHGNSI